MPSGTTRSLSGLRAENSHNDKIERETLAVARPNVVKIATETESGGGEDMFLTERLTFPQIWVESVCESSEEEGDAETIDKDRTARDSNQLDDQLFSSVIPRRHLTGERTKDKVIRSLAATCSSTDVSFESNGSSSGQSSFQFSSREDSVDLDYHGPSHELSCAYDDLTIARVELPVEDKSEREHQGVAAGKEATAHSHLTVEGQGNEASEKGYRDDVEERPRPLVGVSSSPIPFRGIEQTASIEGSPKPEGGRESPFQSTAVHATGPRLLFSDDASNAPAPPSDFHTPVALVIQRWLERLQSQGFRDAALAAFSRPEIDYDDEDETWFQTGVVRVFDPYYDIDAEDIEEIIEGKKDKRTGLPVGMCTVKLKSGDELFGTFKNGVRQGRGSIEGVNLLKHGLICVRGHYKDGVLLGPGSAVLAQGGMWAPVEGRITLEGVFNDGFLEGPVRGTDDSGALVFAGQYQKGLPVGTCWLATEGQGWLCGRVDDRGRFTGGEIAFLYPDRFTGMIGNFEQEVMLGALAARVTTADLNEADILCLDLMSVHPENLSHYSQSASDATGVHCQWDLPDCYEAVTVECRSSSVDGAGDGLFALRELPEGRVVAFYNGVRVQPDENYHTDNFDYQIYVDWSDTDRSAFVDVPRACADVANYRASLAHKANHSFRPNCCYVAVKHPRFGRIPALKTLRVIGKDEELFAHYKYDMALAPMWYQKAWEKLQRSEGQEQQDDEHCEERYD